MVEHVCTYFRSTVLLFTKYMKKCAISEKTLTGYFIYVTWNNSCNVYETKLYQHVGDLRS